MPTNILSQGKNVIEIEMLALKRMHDRIGDSFVDAANRILNVKGKVIFAGIGKSGHIARKLASTFSSTGTPSLFLHPSESSHGDLGVVGVDDLMVLISYGGGGSDLNGILIYAKRKNIPLIALTGNLQSPLAKEAQVVLDISVEKEACPHDLAPTASSTATLALGDALAMVVMTQRGFKAEDFAEFHPGGSLGFKLSRVKENMHTGPGFVLASENTPIKKLISLMSQAETRGAAGVVNENQELVGIVTDGDIRRRLEGSAQPLEGVASDMMSRTPRTIDASEVAERALFMMEQFRINLLFVLDKSSSSTKVPVGVVHIQDLLRNKVR